jgi:hypothetical protein
VVGLDRLFPNPEAAPLEADFLNMNTKAGGVENRPSAKMRGTPKSLRSENYTKSQWNARNSSKVLYVIEKKQI